MALSRGNDASKWTQATVGGHSRKNKCEVREACESQRKRSTDSCTLKTSGIDVTRNKHTCQSHRPSTTQRRRNRNTLRNATSGEMITKTQENYIVCKRRIYGYYHFTLLEQLSSSPKEIKQKKKHDRIFLEIFDHREKAKERDGIWHVRKPKTTHKD